MNIHVYDRALSDPDGYRARALAREFKTVDVGAQFHGIAFCGEDATIPRLIANKYNLACEVTFFRRSPEGQAEPNFIHTDCDMGEWTGILYLTPHPPDDDGTVFWRRIETGAIATESGATSEANLAEVLAWRDRAQWEPWYRVHGAYNRLVLFPSAYYHSRAIENNYGAGESARLTQVLFGLGALPEVEVCLQAQRRRLL